MNCKPRDLALIVRSAAGNEGGIVRVIRWEGPYLYIDGASSNDTWLVECLAEIRGVWGQITKPGGTRHISDLCLRPIRDPGEFARDQTISWAPVPLPVVDPSMLEGK